MRTGTYGQTGTIQFVCLQSISQLAQAYLREKQYTFRIIDQHTCFLLLRHNGQLGDFQVNEDGDISVSSTGVALKIRNEQAYTMEEK